MLWGEYLICIDFPSVSVAEPGSLTLIRRHPHSFAHCWNHVSGMYTSIIHLPDIGEAPVGESGSPRHLLAYGWRHHDNRYNSLFTFAGE